jgi:hypothetical protein
MSGSFDSRGRLEISDGRVIFCAGKKKSGKSVLARMLFDSYGGDRVVLDVAGDDGPDGPDVITLRGSVDTLPVKWPEEMRPDDGRRMTLRYVPDPGSPTVAEDMDHVVGLAREQGKRLRSRGRVGVALLIHEVGLVAPEHNTRPHMRRALMQNRHDSLTLIMCGPRPKAIDTLVLSQSDLVYIFEVRNPDDQKRLAENIGWSPRDLHDAILGLGPHEYLRFDANEQKPADGEPDIRLLHFPALPADVVREQK